MQKTVTEEEKKSFKDLEERVKLLAEFDKFQDPGTPKLRMNGSTNSFLQDEEY